MNKLLLFSSLSLGLLSHSIKADPTSPFNDGSVPIIESVQSFERDLIDPDTGERVFELAPFIVRPYSYKEALFFEDTKKNIQKWKNEQILSDFKKFKLIEGGIFKKMDFGKVNADIGITWTKKNKAEWALFRVRW